MFKLIVAVVSLVTLSCSQRLSISEKSSTAKFDHDAVYNGQVLSQSGQYPASRSVVLLQIRNNGKPSGFCTAVLIGNSIGLTAAHCLEGASGPGKRFDVVFGLSQWDVKAIIREGESFRIHPSFRTQQVVYTFTFAPGKAKTVTLDKRYDVAIFSFEGVAPNGFVPAAVYSDAADLSGQPIYIYGAGHSQYFSGESYGSTQYNSGEFGFLRRGQAIIAQGYSMYPDFYLTDPASQSHTCMGDSGGPDFLANARVPTVTGIHSAMIVNDLDGKNIDSVCGHTAIMTKLAGVSAWIAEQKSALEAELK